MVYIYCRVSTKKQGDKGYSFEQQKRLGEEFAKANNQEFTILSETESGTKDDRKEWMNLLNAISKANNEDILFFNVQDRLGRNTEEFERFKKVCVKSNIQVWDNLKKRYMYYDEDGDDISSTIESKVSEREIKKIKKRTYDNMKESWNQGKRVHTKVYGYESSTFNPETGKRIWKVVPEEASNIKRMYELHLKGKSLHQVAHILNDEGRRKREGKLFDYQDIMRAMHKSIYAGLTLDDSGNLIKSKLYEAIIPEKWYYKVTEQYESKVTEQKRGRNPLHLGSGMLVCPYCGSGFWVYKGRGYLYYKHNAKVNCGGQKLFQYDTINSILSTAYGEAILSQPKILNVPIPKGIEEDLKRIKALISKEEKAIEGYDKAIATGSAVDYFAKKIDEALKTISKLKKDSSLIEEKYKEELKQSEMMLANYAVDNVEKFLEAQGQEKRRLLKTIITKVETSLPLFQVHTIDGRILEYNYKEEMKDLMNRKKKRSSYEELLDQADEKTKKEYRDKEASIIKETKAKMVKIAKITEKS